MKLKKITALIITLLLILLCGCSNKDAVDTSSVTSSVTSQIGKRASETIRLLYSSKDTLDPYTCVTEQNSNLSQLIFEPLLIINNQYEIEYRLAKSAVIEDNLCTITLRNAKFSDGTEVTANDVVFSFNKAKKSTTTHYSGALKYASSAEVQDTKTLTISLKRKDPYFINLLTFPIMKKDSDKLKDTDNQSLVPIGAGRYVFNNQKETLSANNYYYGEKSVISTIITVDCPDDESCEQAITAGMVDHYFTDLSNNVIPKMNGNSADILQNRIVFLGINSNNPQLSNSLFRQAFSSAIDRTEICNSAYYGKANPALGPFPTVWKPAEGLLSIDSKSNFEIAKNNIELAGYTNKNKDGYYLLKNNSPITFSLLVNSNNESRVAVANKIAENLATVGIKINVNSVKEKQYYSLIKSKSYDLYLGEIRFEDNMDLGGLISLKSGLELLPSNSHTSAYDEKTSKNITVTSSSSSITDNGNSDDSNGSKNSAVEQAYLPGEITLTTVDAYKGFYSGKYNLQDLITAFNAELPVIPICFRNGLVIYSDRFGNGITPSKTELFHGIQFLN